MQTCHVRRLGRLGYSQALQLQRQLVRQRKDRAIPNTLLLVEHPPVFTVGRRQAEGRSHILVDQVGGETR